MKVVAIKKEGHYIIPYFEKIHLKRKRVELEFDEKVLWDEKGKEKNVEKSETYKQLEKLNKDLGGDELIESIMKGMPLDYKYTPSGKSDKEIWYEERREKYE